MLNWPDGETFNGELGTRDITRMRELIRALEEPTAEEAIIFAPEVWEAAPGLTRTQTYKEHAMLASIAQVQSLRLQPQSNGVPGFDVMRAAGTAGLWNYAQPTHKKGKSGAYVPPSVDAKPNPDSSDEFLRIPLKNIGSYRNSDVFLRIPNLLDSYRILQEHLEIMYPPL